MCVRTEDPTITHVKVQCMGGVGVSLRSIGFRVQTPTPSWLPGACPVTDAFRGLLHTNPHFCLPHAAALLTPDPTPQSLNSHIRVVPAPPCTAALNPAPPSPLSSLLHTPLPETSRPGVRG